MSFFDLSHFRFSRPASWEWVDVTKTNSVAMTITKAGSAPAKLLMIHYPITNGLGKRSAALKRWNELFLETDRRSQTNNVTIGGRAITFLEVAGTLKGEKGADSQPNYAMLGAVFEDQDGNIATKLVGPQKVIAEVNEAFRKMIESGAKQDQ